MGKILRVDPETIVAMPEEEALWAKFWIEEGRVTGFSEKQCYLAFLKGIEYWKALCAERYRKAVETMELDLRNGRGELP